MVLNRAGMTTVPMETGTVSIAKLTGDVTAGWHGENAALSSSDPTFGQAVLRAKTVYDVARLSVELAQDSENIEGILQRSLTEKLAHAIDSAGLVGISTDAAAAPGGVFDLDGRSIIDTVGEPANYDHLLDGYYGLLSSDVSESAIGAAIAHPKYWRKMAGFKTGISGDQTTLAMPPEIARLPKFKTTAAPLDGSTAKIVMGAWADLLYGVRLQLQVRVLQEAYLGSNLQLGIIAYARCDFVATRPAAFCTIEDIDLS